MPIIALKVTNPACAVDRFGREAMLIRSADQQSGRLIQLYYAATAVFLLLDYYLGINFRLAPLDAFPGWRAAYYLFCFACLGMMIWRPSLSQLIATGESLITLSMLIISMGVRVLTVPEFDSGAEGDFVTGQEIVNFVISGSVAWIAYMQGNIKKH